MMEQSTNLAVFLVFKRRTNVTPILVAMEGSAQKQMVHIFALVWRDTKDPIVKVSLIGVTA